MANPDIEKLVDDLIAKGRVPRDLRSEYVQHFESGLQNQILMGSDYTRKTQQLAEERRQAEQAILQERQRLQQDRQKLDGWYSQVQNELNEYEKVKKEVLPTMAAYEQTLKDYQIIDQVTKPAIPISTPSNPTPRPMNQDPVNPNNANPFITRNDFEKVVTNYAAVNGKVDKLKAQHYELFGKWLDEDLVTHYFNTGQDPEEYWRVKYGVDSKKAEMDAKNREAELARLKEEARQEVLREYAVDPSRVVGAPGGQVKGGLSPVFEQYSASRALSHSQNHANDDAAIPKRDEFVPPEKRPDLAMQADRVSKASELFAKHFDITGNPITEEGRKLSQRYASSS